MQSSWANEYLFWNDRYGKIYHHLEGSTPYKKLIDDIINFLPLRDGLTILDAGVGSGYLVERVISRFRPLNIVALDISPIQLAHFKKRIETKFPSVRNSIRTDLHDLCHKTNYSNGYFDLIISNLVLTYITEYEGSYGINALGGVLREMYRILKLGGILCWSTPIPNVKFWKIFLASYKDILDPHHLERLYFAPRILHHALSIQRKGREGIYHFYQQERIIDILNSIGYKDIIVKRSFANQALIFRCSK